MDMRHFAALIFVMTLSFSIPVQASGGTKEEEIPSTPMHVAAQIFTHPSTGKKLLAVSFYNHPEWHTYWDNPGDAGLPIKAEFSRQDNGQAVAFQPLERPTPKRYIEQGKMWAFGHEGEYTYFYEPTAAVQAPVKAQVTWLICKNICIPGKADLTFDWPAGTKVTIAPEALARPVLDQAVLAQRLKALPRIANVPSNLSITLVTHRGDDAPLALYYEISGFKSESLPVNRSLLTPFPLAPFDFHHEELYREGDGKLVGRMLVGWDGQYQEPEMPLPDNGVFKRPFIMKFIYVDPATGEAQIISKNIDRFLLNTNHQEQVSKLTLIGESELQRQHETAAPATAPASPSSSTSPSTSIWPILILALLGGLILNIMPCVLPVISIKLFGLLKMREEGPRKLVVHNLMYTAGVLVSFLILALVVVALKAAGTSVGWGFQLQSPKFVFLMIVVLFIFTLNLFELFEFRTPGGQFLGQLRLEEGPIGDFFSGVLATILSTPCSAPFLGTALTFAFQSSESVISLIFLMIGLGLSLPFLLTAAFPRMINFLPKPGKWMVHVKKFLGLTLILTCIWLIDVFVALSDGGVPLMKLLTILTTIFFFFYFRRHISQSARSGLVVLLVPLAMSFNLLQTPLNSSAISSGLLADKQLSGGLAWKAWSEAAMDDYKRQGKLVFIDFTAKWCFTCKVNEKLVLETQSFQKLAQEHNMELLLADWTRHDPVIGAFLKKNGMVGVPAYFVQKKDGTLVNLGETITLQKIAEQLK